jgi:hypothetical protein
MKGERLLSWATHLLMQSFCAASASPQPGRTDEMRAEILMAQNGRYDRLDDMA